MTMTGSATDCLLWMNEEHHAIEDFGKGVPRWCSGCGDNAILAAIQRLCRDEGLRPEKIVSVSGIGCSSRLPHYMNTYGFHSLHGRALPVAEGIRMARPDLDVFVNTGDGDCFSIGAGHWVHALRYNANLVVIVHDNQVYGLTKNQVSPTSPKGLKTNTTPLRGAYLEGLNPLTVTLGVTNVSFVANAVDWIPELLYDIIRAAYRHRGTAFIRVVQRCPEFMPKHFDAYVKDPTRVLLLHHAGGVRPSPAIAAVCTNQLEHDPSDIHRARQIASTADPIPVGILFHDPSVPCYEDVRRTMETRTTDDIRRGLEAELDKVTIWPEGARPARSRSEKDG